MYDTHLPEAAAMIIINSRLDRSWPSCVALLLEAVRFHEIRMAPTRLGPHTAQDNVIHPFHDAHTPCVDLTE